MKTEENVLLSKFTTLKVGGPARFFVRIKNKEDLLEAFDFISKNKLSFFILGGGSNVLAPDAGFAGAVLKIEIEGVLVKEKEGDQILLEVGAGESWDALVEFASENNFWGIENLSGIPGTVGASAIQNIGAYGTEAKDVIGVVEVFDPKTGEVKILKNTECSFGYRDSLFKKEEHKDLVVTKVFFELSKLPKPNILYKDLKAAFPDGNPDIRDIRKTVIEIRKKKFPDLSIYGTAGSFFKNIITSNEEFAHMQKKFPEVVAFDFTPGKKKISSAWILDKVLGLKGAREGEVGLFPEQALVLVNFGNATSSEIKNFTAKIKKEVREKTGLLIEEEVVMI